MTSRNECTRLWTGAGEERRTIRICKESNPQFPFLSTHLHRNPFLCIHSSSISPTRTRFVSLSQFLPPPNLLPPLSFLSPQNIPQRICRLFLSLSLSLFFSIRWFPPTPRFCVILHSLLLFRSLVPLLLVYRWHPPFSAFYLLQCRCAYTCACLCVCAPRFSTALPILAINLAGIDGRTKITFHYLRAIALEMWRSVYTSVPSLLVETI